MCQFGGAFLLAACALVSSATVMMTWRAPVLLLCIQQFVALMWRQGAPMTTNWQPLPLLLSALLPLKQ
jgi:hypothetical protein